jgi:hypothetical protein
MFKTHAAIPVLIGLVLSSCATRLPERPIHASLVLWPKDADRDCDFEAPRRDMARTLTYSLTPQATSSRGSPVAAQSYAARGAQIRQRPTPGEVLCLVVSRGPTNRATALIGFEVRAVTAQVLEVTPVRARVDRAAFGTPRAVALSVGLATASYDQPHPDPASSARFDLGVVPTDGRVVGLNLAAQRLHWPPTSDETDILRMGATVLEATPGAAVSIRNEDLTASLYRTAER